MKQTAALRFWAECPYCKTTAILPEWSESNERETVNFWCCSICEKEFQTVHQAIKQPPFNPNPNEPFLPNLLVA